MKPTRKIAYFAGCTANYIDPDVGKATIKVLEKNGLQPILPDQKCCATPNLAYGDVKGFIKHAKFNVHSLVQADCDIVTACTSCALTIKREYPDMLKTPEARAVALRTYDIMEYLVILMGRNTLNKTFQSIGLRLLYHSPCHLRVLGRELVDKRLELMRLIPGITITALDRGCCGMGGTFGLKQVNYDMSMAIGQPLFEEVKRLSPDMVITECPGCSMQISHGTGTAVTHPINIIKDAYGT